MGCELNPSIPYTEFSVIIKKQKEVCVSAFKLFHCLPFLFLSLHSLPFHLICLPQIIKKLIERKQAQIRKVYPGLSCFKEGVRQIPIENIPGIRKLFTILTPHYLTSFFHAMFGLCLTFLDVFRRIYEVNFRFFISPGETGWKPVGKG